MTAAKKCKEAGLPSLKYLSEKTKTPIRTLTDWNKYRPEVFRMLVLAATYEMEK